MIMRCARRAAAWESDRRFADAKIFCRPDIAMSATLQSAVPYECPQTEAGMNSRGEPAGAMTLASL